MHSKSHSTISVLQKLDGGTRKMMDLLDKAEWNNNDTSSNALESFLNVTGRSSIMKKTQLEHVSGVIKLKLVYICSFFEYQGNISLMELKSLGYTNID